MNLDDGDLKKCLTVLHRFIYLCNCEMEADSLSYDDLWKVESLVTENFKYQDLWNAVNNIRSIEQIISAARKNACLEVVAKAEDGYCHRAIFVDIEGNLKIDELKIECPSCFGEGIDEGEECSLCNGSGWLE
jgi:hypothetical protein